MSACQLNLLGRGDDDMERKTYNIPALIFAYVMSLIGLFVIYLPFLRTFSSSYAGARFAVGTIIVLLPLLFCIGYIKLKHKWLIPIILIAVIGIVLLIYNRGLIIGFCNFIDEIIETISDAYDAELWFIDAGTRYVKKTYEALAICIISGVIAVLFTFCVYKRKIAFIPGLILAAMSVGSMLVAEERNYILLIVKMFLCVGFVVIGFAATPTEDSKGHIPYITSIIMSVILGIVTIPLMNSTTEEEYQHSNWAQNIYNAIVEEDFDFEKVVESFKEIFTKEDDGASSIGGGMLGHLDELKFSGKEVAIVQMPHIAGKYYLKGYVADTYTSTAWKTKYTKYDNVEQTLGSVILNGIYIGDEVLCYNAMNSFNTTMYVKYTGPRVPYTFRPLYYVDSTLTNNDFTKYSFVHVDQDALPYIDIFLRAFKPEPAMNQYAYEHFLDVNTPMAKELKIRWGGYSIDTAYERYAVANAIRNYLSDNCKYSLTPGKVPDNEDFVEYFLKDTKEGYCTYFATAAVMMLRSAGIPARYVEGYAFNQLNMDDISVGREDYVSADGTASMTTYTYSIKDNNAHAWVEYYVDDVGWIDIDVTPGAYLADNHNQPELETTTTEQITEETTTENATTNETTTAEPENTTSVRPSQDSIIRTTEETIDTYSDNNLWKKILRAFIIVFVIACLGAVIFTWQAIKIRNRNAALDMAQNGEVRKALIYINNLFEKLVRTAKLERKDYMTDKMYTDWIASEFPELEGSVRELMKIMEITNYSENTPNYEDYETAQILLRRIYRKILDSRNYLIRIIYCIRFKNML